jgi:DNA polymerase III subunit gamma/tau
VLSRTWQMLLKGIAEVRDAAKPIAAAEMVLVRIAYAADLPTPDEVIRSLDGNGARPQGNTAGTAGSAASAPAPRPQAFRSEVPGGALRSSAAPATAPLAQSQAIPAIVISRFEDLIALASEKRDLQMKTALERDVRLVRCEDGRLEIGLENGAAKAIVGDLARKLSQWTGRRWMVVVSAEVGAPSLKAQSEAKQAELKTGVQAHPLVQSVLTRFPGAEITRVQRREQDLPLEVPSDPADDTAPEPFTDNDDSAFGTRSAAENSGKC